MKKLFTCLLLLVWTQHSKSQITINASDVPGVGYQIFTTYDVAPNPSINGGPGGANQTWDFSGLIPSGTDTIDITSPVWTPNGSSFPDANLAYVLPGESFFYAELNSSGLYLMGLDGDLFGNGTNTQIFMNPSYQRLSFPLTMNTSFNVHSKNELKYGIAPGDSELVTLTAIGNTIVDSWGTLTLPTGAFDVLRLNESLVEYDSAWTYSGGIWSLDMVYIDTAYTYYWFTNADAGGGWPIVEFGYDPADNSPNGGIDFLFSPSTMTNIADEPKANTVLAYPNPATHYITFNPLPKNATLIDVFDLTGKEVLSQNVHAGEPITMDLKEIPDGMYYYLIKGKKNETVCSGKMVISR